MSRRQIDNFQGTDAEYIAYLESKVTQLIVHLHIPQPISPPSPPSDNSDDDAPIKFIQFDPNILPRPAKRKRTTPPRWQIEMDEILREISDVQDWSSKRAQVGLSSSAKILLAFDMIIHGSISFPEPALGSLSNSTN